MSSICRIILLVTLCSFTFTASAADMLCDLSDLDKKETQNSHADMQKGSCHDSDNQQSSDDAQSNCCHDMNLCHISLSILSGNEALAQVFLVHVSIQKQDNDDLIFNSPSPPDRPPKLLA